MIAERVPYMASKHHWRPHHTEGGVNSGSTTGHRAMLTGTMLHSSSKTEGHKPSVMAVHSCSSECDHSTLSDTRCKDRTRLRAGRSTNGSESRIWCSGCCNQRSMSTTAQCDVISVEATVTIGPSVKHRNAATIRHRMHHTSDSRCIPAKCSD